MSTLTDILSPIESDMTAVDRLIRESLSSDVVLINQLGEHIVAGGGKRLRPALALLSARALGYHQEAHHTLATVIEFIHTATLLHDDVVDHSDLRRGNPTANALWGNEASVLTGDFLYSRAFQLMIGLNSLPILDALANATNLIAEGEVLQLMNCFNPDITEATYDQVIDRKTAVLFAAATRCGGLLAQGDDRQIDALSRFGQLLGMTFQLIDDCLDYRADSASTGKNLGDDLAEGKTTLPIIITLQRAAPADQARLREALSTGNRDELQWVISLIEASDAIAYTARRAAESAAAAIGALDVLPPSPYKSAMVQLAEFSAARAY